MKKFTRTEQMRQAIADGKAKKVEAASARKPPAEKKPKRSNWRSAPARDARAKSKGRLPKGSHFRMTWTGETWAGELWIPGQNGAGIQGFTHSSDGLFRLAEELDVKFWEWYATAPEDVKKQLVFAENPPVPEGKS